MTHKYSNYALLIGFFGLMGLLMFAPGSAPAVYAGFTETPTAVPPDPTNTPVALDPTNTPVPATSTPVPASTNTPAPAATNTPSSSTNNPQPTATKNTSSGKQPTPTNTPVPLVVSGQVRTAAPANPPVVPALGEGVSMGFLLSLNAILLAVLVGLFFAWRMVSKSTPVPTDGPKAERKRDGDKKG